MEKKTNQVQSVIMAMQVAGSCNNCLDLSRLRNKQGKLISCCVWLCTNGWKEVIFSHFDSDNRVNNIDIIVKACGGVANSRDSLL